MHIKMDTIIGYYSIIKVEPIAFEVLRSDFMIEKSCGTSRFVSRSRALVVVVPENNTLFAIRTCFHNAVHCDIGRV